MFKELLMDFKQKVSVATRRHMANLQKMYNERVRTAEVRAKYRLASAKTKTEKGKIKLQLERERLDAKRELYEAQIATKKAKVAVEKARKEAGDLTLTERVEKTYKYFMKGSKRRKAANKNKPKKVSVHAR